MEVTVCSGSILVIWLQAPPTHLLSIPSWEECLPVWTLLSLSPNISMITAPLSLVPKSLKEMIDTRTSNTKPRTKEEPP